MIPSSEKAFNQVIFVEDDEAFRSTIQKYLQKKGYEVTSVGSAIEFYKEFDRNKFALAIIDIRLPDQNGLVLSRYVRANSCTRIMLLTGDPSENTRIDGYEAGADHYLVKPVNFRLLDAELESLLMRVEEHQPVYHEKAPIKSEVSGYLQDWKLRVEAWELINPCGEKLHLTAKEFTFLHALAETPNLPVSRNTLLARLGYSLDVFGNRSLESLIYRLRKKISPTLETPIKSVSSSGYTFTARIEIEN